MYSSLSVRISKPGPNLTFPLRLSRVAGELNRAEGAGFGGSDWPGAAAPPDADGAAVGAGGPPSRLAGPPLAGPPAVPSPAPGAGPPPGPAPGGARWVLLGG